MSYKSVSIEAVQIRIGKDLQIDQQDLTFKTFEMVLNGEANLNVFFLLFLLAIYCHVFFSTPNI